MQETTPGAFQHFMATDSAQVLKNGVQLGMKTWRSFLERMEWAREQVDRVICHQVGRTHRDTILKMIGLDPSQEFPTFPFLGNVGTVSLPLSAALAEERGFLQPGQRVGFLGIGSGLNCLMLGWDW
jgi:3-oxoacyl-[acyl-carrier-protein] synthase-3